MDDATTLSAGWRYEYAIETESEWSGVRVMSELNPNRERECGTCGITWVVSRGEGCPLCETRQKNRALQAEVVELRSEVESLVESIRVRQQSSVEVVADGE